MQVVDTHVHYNMEPLESEWALHWQKAQAQGVVAGLVVGANLETSHKAVAIAQKQTQLKAAVGIHPEEAEEPGVMSQVAQIRELATQPEVIAIGEIGLDYFRLGRQDQDQFHQIVDLQKQLFIAQLQIALDLNLPLSIHTRDRKLKTNPTPDNAYWDVLAIMEEHFLNQPQHPNWVLHCASGSPAYIEQAAQLGAYFGVDGNVTYQSARELREIVQLMPPDKILVETDAPYLAPEPHRGQTCEPWMVTLTAQFLEKEMGINPEQLVKNTQQIFNLPQPPTS